MDDLDRVLCFCPARRFSLVSLVLSTWTGVRRYVLTDNEATDPEAFSAVIVMDELVTKAHVERLAAKLPVFVLAWNGMFEIERYRELLGESADVTYVGTDEELSPELDSLSLRYVPMINSRCAYADWRALFRHKRRFSVHGNVAYRSQWFRMQLTASRWWRLLVSSGGALLNRPETLRKTVESGFVAHKLVWAGNCHFDLSGLGLPAPDQEAITARVAEVRAMSEPDDRLRAALGIIDQWRDIASESLGPTRAHNAVYVTNTLLRWAVLDFFVTTAKESTWFFGQDNLGLGLEYELYVYNLVPNQRIAFLDFGGKTSETTLYPRSLHLLAGQCYVIGIVMPDEGGPHDALVATVDRIRRRLNWDERGFFTELEARRQALYANLPARCTLAEVQRRVWGDFTRAATVEEH